MKAIDSEGEDSGWVERWVDVQTGTTSVPEVMAVAEGQSVSLSGVAWDTVSDMEDLIVWDIDPGADTDGIGSADDCDVTGNNLTWAWQNAGVYNVVFHATDDNGARNSFNYCSESSSDSFCKCLVKRLPARLLLMHQ